MTIESKISLPEFPNIGTKLTSCVNRNGLLHQPFRSLLRLWPTKILPREIIFFTLVFKKSEKRTLGQLEHQSITIRTPLQHLQAQNNIFTNLYICKGTRNTIQIFRRNTSNLCPIVYNYSIRFDKFMENNLLHG